MKFLDHVVRLLEGHHGGDRVAVGEILVPVLAAGALHKGHPDRHLAVLRQLFELGIGDHALDGNELYYRTN